MPGPGTVGAAVGTVEGRVRAVGLAPPGVVAEGVRLAAGELLAGVVLLAGAVAVGPVVPADGAGAGRAGDDLPLTPPPRVVPWPGWPWTRADSGLPACSTSVTATAQPMNAATASAAGPAQRRGRRARSCRAAAA